MDSFAIISAMKYWAKVINSSENEYIDIICIQANVTWH